MQSVINAPSGASYMLTYDPELVWARKAKLVALIKGHIRVSSQEALGVLKEMRDHSMLFVAKECPDIFEVRNLTWEAELESRAAEARRLAHIQKLLRDAQDGDATAALEFCKTFNPLDWAICPGA